LRLIQPVGLVAQQADECAPLLQPRNDPEHPRAEAVAAEDLLLDPPRILVDPGPAGEEVHRFDKSLVGDDSSEVEEHRPDSRRPRFAFHPLTRPDNY